MAVEILVSFAIERVNDMLNAEVDLLSSVRSNVQSLQRELVWMRSYMRDADSRYEEGDERFRTSMSEIRRIAFDVEDAVDSFILESSSARRQNLATRCAFVFQSIARIHRFGASMSGIKERIQENTDRLIRYGVKNSNEIEIGVGMRSEKRFRSRKAYPHVEDHDIVGLDEDIELLVGQLVDETSKTWVVSIVGMGGSGKTTLARQIYNHGSVKQQFGCRAWVSISQSWDKRDVLLDIFRQFVQNSGEGVGCSDQELLEKLYCFLKDRVYLVVLDDTWKLEAWKDVFPALPHNKGSKILITTRNENVPLHADPRCIVHDPHFLSEDEGWELFRRKAFVDEEIDDRYVKMGREMVKKCNGLPLAVSALGGLMRTKRGLDEWERTFKALTSNVMKANDSPLYGRVDEMLALSYHDLPYELKPCFLYLGLFPEDYEIKAGMLIRMWMAEGFVASDQLSGEESLEDVGRQYLDELIHRCLLQAVKRNHMGKVTTCRMHDLIRDLCVRKAMEQDFLKIYSPTSDVDTSVAQARRAALHFGDSFPEHQSHLRSLIRFGPNGKTSRICTDLSLGLICKNYKLLRVLNLWGLKTSDKTLPKQIGTLMHLRYLGIRLTNISKLPHTIGNLHNLLTLDYRRIRDDTESVEVPIAVWKMEHLRHLYLPWGTVNPMDKLRSMKQLQTLWGVAGGVWIETDLVRTSTRIQKLAIADISNEKQLATVFQCPSIVSDSLRSLTLNWSSLHLDSITDTELPRVDLGHCEHLRSLILKGRIRKGISLCFPPNLTKLQLYFSQVEGQDPMEILGNLRSLKILWLWNAYLGTRMSCKTGKFPALEILMMFYMINLDEWRIEEGTMPVLRKLQICTCGQLNEVPEGLQFITTLQKLVVKSMPFGFVNSVRRARMAAASDEGGYARVVRGIPLVQIC